MANVLDNEVVLEQSSGMVVWRNLVSGVDLLQLYHAATDPNGVLTAPIGSLVSGASGLWENVDGGTTWALVLTSLDGAFLAPNEYYVDTTAVVRPVLRIYTTVAAAIAAGEADQPGPYLIRLRMGQAHTYTMGAEMPAGSVSDVTIYGDTQQTTLDIGGTWAASGVGAVLRFQNVSVTQSNDVKTGSGRSVFIDNATWNGGDHELRVVGGDFSATDSAIGNTFITGAADSAMLSTTFMNCTVGFGAGLASPFISGTQDIKFENCVVDITCGVNATYFTNGAAAFTIDLVNSTFDVNQTAASGTVIDNAPGATLSAVGAYFKWSGAGTSTFASPAFGVGFYGVTSIGKTIGVSLFNLPSGTWYDNAGTVSVVP